MKVATSEEIHEMDRRAEEEHGIPTAILMENAGKEIFQAIHEKIFPLVEGKEILVICGKGNNGGDGFVVARHLYNGKAKVTISLLAEAADYRGDPLHNLTILKNMGIDIRPIRSAAEFDIPESTDLIVDAILGVGTTGKVQGLLAEIINRMNRSRKPILSIDVPSGLHASTGRWEGACVKADWTVTMGLMKMGLLFSPGRDLAGEIIIADISIPRQLLDDPSLKTNLVDLPLVKLPTRDRNAYKNNCGKIFVLAGSIGMTGAATFAAQAAMKTGSGLAILGIPSSLHSIVASKLTEVMTTPLPETASHTFGLPAEPFIQEKIKWADVIAMGPGLSQNEETQKLVKKLLKDLSKPVVLDADALNALVNESHLLKKVAHCIITPHPGEFARLFGITSQEVLDRGIQIAREKAQELEIIIVLKGAPTVIASPDGEIYINSTGNPGMATGGAGDILTGMISSLVGQGLSIKEAAITGVYVHGLAGDLAKQDKGEMGMTAMDILENIPAALIRAGHSL